MDDGFGPVHTGVIDEYVYRPQAPLHLTHEALNVALMGNIAGVAEDLGLLPHRGPARRALNGRAGKGRGDWERARLEAAYILETSPLHAFDGSEAELQWLRSLHGVVLQRFKPSPLDEVATVILPGRAWTEKAGTATSMEGRVQRLRQAIDAAAVPDDWETIHRLAQALGGEWVYPDLDAVFADLLKVLPGYEVARRGERVLWEAPA